jgi:putative DNA primase/helicase
MTDQNDKELEQIKKDVQKRVQQESEAQPPSIKEREQIPSIRVNNYLRAEELGDGLLYAEVHGGKFIYNSNVGEWFINRGSHWEMDTQESSLAAVEDVAEVYNKEIGKVVERINWHLQKKESDKVDELEVLRKHLTRRVSKLRTDRGRQACLKFARTLPERGLTVKGNVFDRQPWLLACGNGVIDLRLGTISEGDPELYLSMATETRFEGLEEPAPLFEETLRQIFDEDEELIAYLRRLFGYGITGLNIEHVFPVLYGAGRNGKSLLVEVITEVLGPFARPIPAELLLDQYRVRNSAGPSPDIMQLKGLRLAFASETDEGRKFSSSKVKWLTGGDLLVGRNPHDKQPTTFAPSHTLFLLTNSMPRADANDVAFWSRLQLIEFKQAFVDEPKEPHEHEARKELKQELIKERSGILAWLVRGCLQYQRRGLEPPASVKERTAEYRQEEDLVGQFIEERCHVNPRVNIEAGELYQAFCEWFLETVSSNKKSVPKPQLFGRWMSKRWERKKNTAGRKEYVGIELKPSYLNTDDSG